MQKLSDLHFLMQLVFSYMNDSTTDAFRFSILDLVLRDEVDAFYSLVGIYIANSSKKEIKCNVPLTVLTALVDRWYCT